MKKIFKNLSLTLILLIAASVIFTACNFGGNASGGNNSSGGNNGGGNTNVTPEGPTGEDAPDGTPGLIFNSASQLTVIVTDEEFPSNMASDIIWALKENLGSRLSVKYDDKDAAAEHEIILGRADNRVASHMAYSRLEEIMGSDTVGKGGYAVYSDGSSLALACTNELGTQHLEDIVAEMVSWAGNVSLVRERGVVSAKIYDMYEIYAAEDAARREADFATIEKQLGKAFADALRDFYQRAYSSDIVEWLANLYEPRVCVCDNYVNGIKVCLHPTDKDGNDLCSNGGFYYSNSARNTYGFRPDIESTYQALTFMEMSGMLDEFGGKFGGFIDGQLRADIVAFTKSLQNPDGYFYHPQWSIEDSRAHWSRVSRDLMWSTGILGQFKAQPYYNTPDGSMYGPGSRPQTTPSAELLTTRLSDSAVSAVSKVVPTATNLPDHLKSPEALKTYLSKWKMDVFGSGYTAANDLAAQVSLLEEADKQLGGTLRPVIFDYLNEKINPDTGFWRAEVDYDGANTLFKAIMVYSAFGEYFPAAEVAAESCLALLGSEEVPGHVCCVYNTWYNIAGLIGNIKKCHPSADRVNIANGILARMRELAPTALRNTIDKTLIFRREDFSFSYFADKASQTSQGMPVCTGVLEGDINASIICSGGLLQHISQALSVSLPSIFGTYELAVFMDIIETNESSIKDSLPPDVIADFENESPGIETQSVGVANGSGGSGIVEKDPLNPNNQALHFTSFNKSGTWNAITIPNNTYKFDTNCLVLEGDFMFSKEGTSQGTLAQFYMGSMGKKSAYLMTIDITSTHVVVNEESTDVYNDSFRRQIGKFKLDEWFKLRIEYYCGKDDEELGITAHETTRIKIYTNDELVAVSANYYDQNGAKFANGTGTPNDEIASALFYVMSYCNTDAYFDNLYLGYKKIEYKSEKDTKGLLFNEDAEGDRLEYSFDENELPEDMTLTGSSITVENEKLTFLKNGGTSTLKIPQNQRAPLSNVYSIGFDVKFDSTGVAEGGLFTIKLKSARGTDIATYTMRCAKIDGALALVPLYKGSTVLPSAAVFDDGESHHLEFAFFVESATTLIYKDGQFIASTEQGVVAKHYLHEMDYVQIENNGKALLTLDNLYCEKRVGNFAEEVEPKIEREQLDFSSGSLSDMENLTTNGRIENGMLNIAGSYAVIAANERSPYVSAYQFYMDINTTRYNSQSPTYVRFIDANGNTVIGIAMVERDGMMYFYEMLNDDTYGEYVGAATYNGAASMLFNFFAGEKVIEVYVNGVLVLLSGQMNGANEKIAAIKVSSASALVNNLYLDGITLTYTAPKVDALTKDDTDEVITYDYSSLGNLPIRMTCDNNINQNCSIEYVERDGTLTKALVYNKVKDPYVNGVRFNFADGQYHANMSFSTDIKLLGGMTTGGWRSTFSVYLANQSGGTHMYIITFNVGSDKHLYMNLESASDSSKKDLGLLPEDGWFNLRIDMQNGDGTNNPFTGNRISVYIDGSEVYSGNGFYGSASGQEKPNLGSVYQVMFLPVTGSTGTIYFDNTVLK